MQKASYLGGKSHTVEGGTLCKHYSRTYPIYKILNSWSGHNCVGFNEDKLIVSISSPSQIKAHELTAIRDIVWNKVYYW